MFFAVGEGGGVGNEVVVIVTSSVFPEHPARGCPLDLGTLNCALGRSRSHISRGAGSRDTIRDRRERPNVFTFMRSLTHQYCRFFDRNRGG
jgi:hypothetical protein